MRRLKTVIMYGVDAGDMLEIAAEAAGVRTLTYTPPRDMGELLRLVATFPALRRVDVAVPGRDGLLEWPDSTTVESLTIRLGSLDGTCRLALGAMPALRSLATADLALTAVPSGLTALQYHPANDERGGEHLHMLLAPGANAGLEALTLSWCPASLIPTLLTMPHLRDVQLTIGCGSAAPPPSVGFEHDTIEDLLLDKMTSDHPLSVEFGRMPRLRDLTVNGGLRVSPVSGWFGCRLTSLGMDHTADGVDRLLDRAAAPDVGRCVGVR
jgi:hypothetical protein